MEKATKSQRSSVLRKRGRPAGKNRVPLTLEERRARNAGYEKERREEIGAAFKELQVAAGLEGNLSAHDLLAEVVYFLGNTMQSASSSDIDKIRRCNDNLASQITMLEHRLTSGPDPRVPLPVQTRQPFGTSYPLKRKVEDCGWQSHPKKRFSPDHYWGASASSWHSSYQRVPWLAAELWSREQLHEPSVYPLLSPKEPLSPVSPNCGAWTHEAEVPTFPTAAVSSCSHLTHPDVKKEDLTAMAAVWADTLAFDGTQLSLSQMDCWVTEEDLVSLYLPPIV